MELKDKILGIKLSKQCPGPIEVNYKCIQMTMRGENMPCWEKNIINCL